MHILVFRLSIFGNFKPYGATSENTVAWTQGLHNLGYEFLPNAFQVRQPIMNGPFMGGTQVLDEKRLQFISADGKVAVRILPDRLDVEFPLEKVEDSKKERNLEEKTEIALEIMKFLLHSMDDIQGTRMAYYVDALMPEPAENDFMDFYRNNNLELSVNGSDGECVEWSHRFNSKTQLATDSDSVEWCNFILAMEAGMLQSGQAVPNQPQIIKGLRVIADINTLGEESAERFSINSLVYFIKNAQKIYLDLLEQLNGKLCS